MHPHSPITHPAGCLTVGPARSLSRGSTEIREGGLEGLPARWAGGGGEGVEGRTLPPPRPTHLFQLPAPGWLPFHNKTVLSSADSPVP